MYSELRRLLLPNNYLFVEGLLRKTTRINTNSKLYLAVMIQKPHLQVTRNRTSRSAKNTSFGSIISNEHASTKIRQKADFPEN